MATERGDTLKLGAIALAVLLIAAGWEPGAAQKARVGTVAPNFRLQELAGGTVTLVEYRGRPVLVNF